jgi:limonene-1,2-epoxide hydrolase
MRKAFRTYLTEQVVWDNVGLGTTTGVDEAIALRCATEES